jgi:periodic tryptophan protein 2
VYCQGNLLYNPEGTHLFSPVGNRVTVFDLVKYAIAVVALGDSC